MEETKRVSMNKELPSQVNYDTRLVIHTVITIVIIL
jgi:hypothetical protein